MSSQPVWVTPSGSLGTIPEGAFYSVALSTTTEDSSAVYYTVIAGALPSGIECTINGLIQGVPTNVVTIAQETTTAGLDVTSKFAVRAYTIKTVGGLSVVNRLADRTFTLTIAGQNAPAWITPGGLIEEYFDGSLVEPGYQLLYTNDNTTGYPPAVTLIAGTLPPGLTVSSTGLISGYVGLNPAITVLPGFSREGQGFDAYPFDFTAQSENYNYQFTLRLTDGRISAVQTFSILVWSTNVFNASTTLITADNGYLTASISNTNYPVLLNTPGSIGTAPNNTFFAYQFVGEDANGDQIGYMGTSLPVGLVLNNQTGWLYGYIPNLQLSAITYDFTVTAYVYGNPSISSPAYNYSLTVTGPVSSIITWISPNNLGSIYNGDTSLFSVVATSASGLALQYSLMSGSYSRLPQGLTLLPSGNIVGRVSFDTFSLDNNLTTFDVSTGSPTTFDLTYSFTVEAISTNGLARATNTFTIEVIRRYSLPYYNLYISCLPPANDRVLIGELLHNASIFPPQLLYRSDDPNFGLSSGVVYHHAYGLNAVSLDTYVEALQLSHYWKNLHLGNIQTAQAIDPATGKVIYEVVYSKIIDTLVNNSDTSVSREVVLPYPVNLNTVNEIDVVYPNSLENMRNQVIDVVGQESDVLPLWMLSKQSDGSVLGFTPAWVIAYTNPGASGQIAYNIATQFGDQLNMVDYKADRYELDNALTVNWDPNNITTLDINGLWNTAVFNSSTTLITSDNTYLTASISVNEDGSIVTATYDKQSTIPFIIGDQIVIANVTPASYNGTYYVLSCSTTEVTFSSVDTAVWQSGGTVSSIAHWVPNPPTSTTFDINYHYQTTVQNYFAGGTGYTVGTVIVIAGTVLGGSSPLNDCVFTVNTVNNAGAIVNAFCSGTASIISAGNSYQNVIGTVVSGTGSGAVWNITVVPGKATVFDGGSVTFNSPANMDTNTNAYDRYLMYPNITIIGPSLQASTWEDVDARPFVI